MMTLLVLLVLVRRFKMSVSRCKLDRDSKSIYCSLLAFSWTSAAEAMVHAQSLTAHMALGSSKADPDQMLPEFQDAKSWLGRGDHENAMVQSMDECEKPAPSCAAERTFGNCNIFD